MCQYGIDTVGFEPTTQKITCMKTLLIEPRAWLFSNLSSALTIWATCRWYKKIRHWSLMKGSPALTGGTMKPAWFSHDQRRLKWISSKPTTLHSATVRFALTLPGRGEPVPGIMLLDHVALVARSLAQTRYVGILERRSTPWLYGAIHSHCWDSFVRQRWTCVAISTKRFAVNIVLCLVGADRLFQHLGEMVAICFSPLADCNCFGSVAAVP